MALGYTEVTDLSFGDASCDSILCKVNFVNVGVVPFAAHKDDIEEHGKEIYTRAIAGDFGEIADFIEYKKEVKTTEVVLAGKKVTIAVAYYTTLLTLCYEAVAMGETTVKVPIGDTTVTATLVEARAAIKACKELV